MTISYRQDGRPSLQLYVDDWLSEPGLQACSLAAQGLWIRMICYMHKAQIRGTLKANAKQIKARMLARLVGETEEMITRLLAELEDAHIFSRLPDGTIYCRRMYRQAQKEREISRVRSEAGKLGGRPPKSKAESKSKANKATSTSSSTSTSKHTRAFPNGQFVQIWCNYPRKLGRKAAERHFNTSVKNEQDWKDINTALENFKADIEAKGTKEQFIPYGSTFFNNWRDWVTYEEGVDVPAEDHVAKEARERRRLEREQAAGKGAEETGPGVRGGPEG